MVYKDIHGVAGQVMDIYRSWRVLESVLSVEQCQPEVQWKVVLPSQELREAAIFLGTQGMSQVLEEWLHETVLQDLNKRVSPTFWKFFSDISNVSGDSEFNAMSFSDAFSYLYDVYSKHYLVGLQRLHWLQLLAASAPATEPCAVASAFTPVKTGKTFNAGKGVRFGEMEKPKGLSVSFGGMKAEKSCRAETGHLSVTFEKGSKGDENMETETGHLSVTFEKGSKGDENMETETVDDSIDGDSFMSKHADKRKMTDMDGSFVHAKVSLEHALLLGSSTHSVSSMQSGHDLDSSENNPVFSAVCTEEDDEFESFIRSPIGGNKKLMASSKTKPTPQQFSDTSATPSCLLDLQSSVTGSTTSTQRGVSLTSTPGTALKLTPDPVTPVIPLDASEISMNTSIQQGNSMLSQATPSIHQETAIIEAGSPDILPEPSVVFGVPVQSRPVPGGTVRWPSSDYNKGMGKAQNKIQVMIRAVLFYTFSPTFAGVVKDFYSQAFDIHKNRAEGSGFEEEMKEDEARFDDINKKMDEMGLMEFVSGAAVTEIVHSQIEKHIEDECKGNFDTSYLTDLEKWLDQQILGWLNRIYAGKQTASQLASVVAFRDRLRHFIYETYAKSLISQFFDIIIDYPDSKPAILDLNACLEKTDLRSELVSSLKNALENRLLHPGVNTADILTAYIAAIKSLRLLEPAGVILELVCEPVGRYLRSREDTVRCIVASLTDEGNNELVNELVNTKPVADDNQEEDGNMVGWEDWMPDPVDADPSTVSKNRRSADILSTLVNIYGSKELFVNEYRALLADRILMQYNYDVERELRYLELLKLRFGEAQLHFCEVMLRDVTESRRVNARIQEARKSSGCQEEIDMNAMILSAQFWPTFRDEKIKLPPELQELLEKYTKSFETQKQNRTLMWKPHLGMMNIELELKEETLNFSVSPVQAAIIMKFQEKTKWNIDELSIELEMTASVLRRKIAFWQGQGLLRETSPDVYELVEEKRGRPHDLIMVDEEEIESAMASAQQQKEEEMQIFWTYIQGMLANLDCLTLERIHAMLRMFAMEEPSSQEVSLQELKTFLENKVRDQVLIFAGGVYRLNK